MKVIQAEFNCKLGEEDDEMELEIYNLKNKERQKMFEEYTSQNNSLSSILIV